MRFDGSGLEPGSLRTRVATLDALLHEHQTVLGIDYLPYRHHVYRMFNFCTWLVPLDGDQAELVAIAAALHDIGIWTAGTFDYLEPSAAAARSHLARIDRLEWTTALDTMIGKHHKVTALRDPADRLAEVFRRADWIDVSLGARSFGIPRRFIQLAYVQWPGLGFHLRLIRLMLSQARVHPLNPLPMVRL